MIARSRRRPVAVLGVALSLLGAHARAAGLPSWRSLAQLAPGANPLAVRLALDALQCAAGHGVASVERLAVIDFSQPSTRRRLWIFDLHEPRLLMHELVAHGRNSGGDLATRFSNSAGSLESSLGLYRTLGTYQGDKGYSLRLQGLDPGFNDHALRRAIVIHGARYVSRQFAKREGRIGRSWGCPAVSIRVARRVIDSLKDGQMVFAYYPDPHWLEHSQLLNCPAVRADVARLVAAQTSPAIAHLAKRRRQILLRGRDRVVTPEPPAGASPATRRIIRSRIHHKP
ncbi:MAG TPA: murein L,D-transpeptidase catalytic domain family protein [Steroidobacteraceae bacterium]|nr:murein L,D-transpeptidase catalytic domain family protein [Steroidobacteraceae bacterium]